MHGCLTLRCTGYLLLQFLDLPVSQLRNSTGNHTTPTRLSNTHLFKGSSTFRHCQSCWLLLSRHSQCFRNSVKQCLLTSSSLRCSTDQSTRSLEITECWDSSSNESMPRASRAKEGVVHARSTSCNLPALLHALQLPPPIGLGLADHVVVIIRLASCTDEEGSAEQWCRTGSDLWDFGDVVR